jgi:hypothetical protein
MTKFIEGTDIWGYETTTETNFRLFFGGKIKVNKVNDKNISRRESYTLLLNLGIHSHFLELSRDYFTFHQNIILKR